MPVRVEAEATTIPSLKLRLLGGFDLAGASGPPLSTRKAEALLAYLGVTVGRAHTRAKLAAMLWGDHSDSQARHSLAQTLYLIRRALTADAEDALFMKGQTVALDAARITVDVHEFETLAGQTTPESLRKAMALFAGELLEGFHVAAPEFEHWLRGERTRLRELARESLDALLIQRGEADDAATEIAFAHRLLDHDPLDESLHRALMRLYQREGRTEAALRQFHVCADILRRELDVAPDIETIALHREIKTSRNQATVALERSEPHRNNSSATTFLNDSPSIAVLPFTNLSGDPEQDFFGDGLAGDIITELSRFRSLFVIARNSSFTYKGRAVDVKAVARDLGVRYVLEGSVRKAGQRIRVTGELIDAETGSHIWAERYDRDLDDLFAIQDDITNAIVATIEPEIGAAERARALRRAPETLDAWGLYQKGLIAFYSATEEGYQSAIGLFDRVNAMDPDFALAFAMAAEARSVFIDGWNPDHREALLAEAAEKAQRAIALAPRESMCLALDARVCLLQDQTDLAVAKARHAVALNPNHALAHHMLGVVLNGARKPQEALESFDQAIRLSPNSAFMAGLQLMRAIALFQMERYEEAVEWARRSVRGANPRPLAFGVLVACLSQLDRTDEAKAVLEQLYKRHPNSRARRSLGRLMGPRLPEALRKVGLQE